MLIILKCTDEVIVCTEETYDQTVQEYFVEGGRSLEDYDKCNVRDTALVVSARLST